MCFSDGKIKGQEVVPGCQTGNPVSFPHALPPWVANLRLAFPGLALWASHFIFPLWEIVITKPAFRVVPTRGLSELSYLNGTGRFRPSVEVWRQQHVASGNPAPEPGGV